jgi:SpoVK/Ycf46/Vps4 family AAA+-type ATPase
MANESINTLLEAIRFSPDNVPLRLHLAELMLHEKMYSEAAEQFGHVLQRSYGNTKAQLGLAACYYHQKKYSAAVIVYEQLHNQMPVDAMLLYVRCLLKENSLQQAAELYQRILVQMPGFQDDEIDQYLRVSSSSGVNEEWEEEEDSLSQKYFMEKPRLKFEDVGGMKRVKDEISLKIIQPLKNPDLYKAYGKKIGGGILLYGPPGCGKTFIAKATAGEIEAKFINIGLHDILDMWVGNSEKNLHEIFELARKNAPCVLFFDEVDAIGASRSDLRQTAMRHVINQFLAELDGVQTNNEGILILAATNAPWSVDPAFRRPGRFDRIIFVEPPDTTAREEILRSLLKEKPAEVIDTKKVAEQIPDFSGADIKALIDLAVEEKLRESMAIGSIQPITTKDLLRAGKIQKPTTLEWFSSARNYALYANESGLYDEILRYLKIRK